MSLDSGVVQLAVDKKYTDFEQAIKSELTAKLSDNAVIKKYSKEFDKIQHMKSEFSRINSIGE